MKTKRQKPGQIVPCVGQRGMTSLYRYYGFMHARKHGAHLAALGIFIVLLATETRVTLKFARRLWTAE